MACEPQLACYTTQSHARPYVACSYFPHTFGGGLTEIQFAAVARSRPEKRMDFA